jgi:hypothetical protein
MIALGEFCPLETSTKSDVLPVCGVTVFSIVYVLLGYEEFYHP